MTKSYSHPPSTHKRKLTGLLAQLTPGELEKLKKYLISPFFEIPDKLTYLFNAIQPFHPRFSKKMPSDEALFKAACPGEEFSRQKLNKLFHQLYRHTKSFIAYHELRQNAFAVQYITMRKARYWKDTSHFETFSKELIAAIHLHQSGEAGKGFMAELVKSLQLTEMHEPAYQEFLLLSSQYLHVSTKKFRSDLELLPRTVAALDRHFVYNRLLLACEFENRRQFINQSCSLPFETEVEAYAKQHLANNDFIVRCYLALLQLFRSGPDENLFQQIIKDFSIQLTQLDKKLALALLTFLVNYANQVFKGGNTSYIQHIHQLYQSAHQVGLLVESGRISELKFTNVVVAAALAGDFTAGYDFISNCKDKLHYSSRHEIVTLCHAFLLFHQGDFLKAHDNLIKLPRGSLEQELISRPLLLRCMYELWEANPQDNHEHILAGIEAFRRYLERCDDLSESHRELYYEFIFLLRKMVKYLARGQSRPAAKKRLIQRLQTEPNPISKTWLERKLLALP